MCNRRQALLLVILVGGPIRDPILISTENELITTFAAPDSDNTIDFHSAAYFLKYTGSLYVCREATSAAVNSYDSNASSAPNYSGPRSFR